MPPSTFGSTFGSTADRQLEVQIPINHRRILGSLGLPEHTVGLVSFAYGSASTRFSPRNQRVAAALRQSGLATLLLDLLTPDEERLDIATSEFRFDVEFLADRIVAATDWAMAQPALRGVTQGYFSASTGAAAALIAAAQRPDLVGAVVSRGGRPDLAGSALNYVRAPTLLIIGSQDTSVIESNQQALAQLGATCKELHQLPGASRRFDTRNDQRNDQVSEIIELARAWFQQYLIEPNNQAPHQVHHQAQHLGHPPGKRPLLR